MPLEQQALHVPGHPRLSRMLPGVVWPRLQMAQYQEGRRFRLNRLGAGAGPELPPIFSPLSCRSSHHHALENV